MEINVLLNKKKIKILMLNGFIIAEITRFSINGIGSDSEC